jgi:glycosyltransferase involved in cell wall biosynthesis
MPHSIAFCISDLAVGGAERCFTEVVTRIDRNRFSPTVFCLKPRPAAEQSQLVDRLLAADVEPVFLDLRHTWQVSSAVRRLKAAFRKSQPALIQTFLFHANCIGAMAASRAGIGRIVAGIRVADPRSRYRLWLERRTTRQVSRYVCVSKAVAEFSARVGKLSDEKLTVIPNGVDVDRFQNANPIDLSELQVPTDRKALVYIGRLDPQKRVDLLVNIFSNIANDIPDHDLVIVGNGPARSQLETQTQCSIAKDRIHFVGFRNDVPEILAAANILLLASEWEGMPNVLLEAAAARIPFVSFYVEGTSELRTHADLSQFVDDGVDHEASIRRFGAQIVKIARDRDLANEISHSNLVLAQQFSLESMVTAYEQLYSELLE